MPDELYDIHGQPKQLRTVTYGQFLERPSVADPFKKNKDLQPWQLLETHAVVAVPNAYTVVLNKWKLKSSNLSADWTNANLSTDGKQGWLRKESQTTLDPRESHAAEFAYDLERQMTYDKYLLDYIYAGRPDFKPSRCKIFNWIIRDEKGSTDFAAFQKQRTGIPSIHFDFPATSLPDMASRLFGDNGKGHYQMRNIWMSLDGEARQLACIDAHSHTANKAEIGPEQHIGADYVNHFILKNQHEVITFPKLGSDHVLCFYSGHSGNHVSAHCSVPIYAPGRSIEIRYLEEINPNLWKAEEELKIWNHHPSNASHPHNVLHSWK